MITAGLTHYQVLGISSEATTQDVKDAYRALAMRYHPDRETGDAESFQIVRKAFETLSNQQLRQDYDRTLRNAIVLDAEKLASAYWDRCI